METLIYSFTLGKFRCLNIRDGGHDGRADFVFANAPAEPLAQELAASGLEPHKIPSSWHCLFVDTGEQKILIDTGIGPQEDASQGNLAQILQEEGISLAEIDQVLLTHGHPDHIGGCTAADGELLYPNARYVINEREWAFWTTDSNLAKLPESFGRFTRKNLPPLKENLLLVSGDQAIAPGISILAAPGHTPGHSVVHLASGGEELYFMADVLLHPLQARHPEWTAVVDMDPDLVVATRQRWLSWLAASQSLAHFFHFDHPALGRVVPDGRRFRWQPSHP